MDETLDVVAPAVVLADHIDALAEGVRVVHGQQHCAQPDLGIAVPPEMIEVTFRPGKLHRLGADVEVDHLLAGIAQIVFEHVASDLSADRRGCSLDNDVGAVVDRGLDLIGCFRGAALIVVLEKLEAVRPCLLVVELDQAVVNRGQEHLADRRLAAGQ